MIDINLSQNDKRGYSKAVIDGIYACTKNYILCTDSDNQIKVYSLIENINNLPKEEVFLFGARTPRMGTVQMPGCNVTLLRILMGHTKSCNNS